MYKSMDALPAQHLDEGVVWNANVGHRTHLFLALGLLLEQFHASRHVAAVLLNENE